MGRISGLYNYIHVDSYLLFHALISIYHYFGPKPIGNFFNADSQIRYPSVYSLSVSHVVCASLALQAYALSTFHLQLPSFTQQLLRPTPKSPGFCRTLEIICI